MNDLLVILKLSKMDLSGSAKARSLKSRFNRNSNAQAAAGLMGGVNFTESSGFSKVIKSQNQARLLSF
jgi:hypothetical protein